MRDIIIDGIIQIFLCSFNIFYYSTLFLLFRCFIVILLVLLIPAILFEVELILKSLHFQYY